MTTSAEAVLAVLGALDDAAIAASIGGGWGVDALVGRQTRDHRDLDLCVAAEQTELALGALDGIGYRLVEDQRPTRIVLREASGAEVDLHPLRFLPDGSARLSGFDGVEYVLPAGSIEAAGWIGGRPVRCFSVRQQLVAHEGYEPTERDLADLRVLATFARTASPLQTGEPPMARFAYLYFMVQDPDRVRSVAPRHTEHWHSLSLPGYTGGPFADRSGGLITFFVDRAEEAEQAVANDPFVREGVIERSWLKQWEPVQASPAG